MMTWIILTRTGINALGVLYENYPKHAASLKLPAKFEKFEDPRLHYYCIVRERYLFLHGSAWLSEEHDLKVGKLKADFSLINNDIFDKWANRGDSVILDIIIQTEE